MRESKAWQAARKMERGKSRNEAFQEIRKIFSYSEYDLHSYVCLHRRHFEGIDIHTAQKIATRAFCASERICFGKAKKVRFKGYMQLDSLESKTNAAGIRFRNGRLEWGKVSIKSVIDTSDVRVRHGLAHPVKYCRIVRRKIKGKIRFSIQLALEGRAYADPRNHCGSGTVGLDFGSSTLAVAATDAVGVLKSARLLQFCKELKESEKEVRRMRRKIDRQRRSNNPGNYLPDGTVRKGRRWKKSARMAKTEDLLSESLRRTASHRKSLHGRLANEIVRMGNVFKTEAISGKWLQKLYGKSVGTRSPKMFIQMLKHKAESANASIIEFPTTTTRLSQTCVCGRVKKKKLSERVHSCECGAEAQRDLLSAFLAIFVEGENGNQQLQADHALAAWSGADKLLRMSWEKAEYAIGGTRPSSFGGSRRSQSISSDKGRIAKGEVQDVVAAARREPGRVGGGSFQIKTLVSNVSAERREYQETAGF
jgi:transposase